MATALDEKPVPIIANQDAPDIFADGAVGAFVTNGNMHITLVARRCDYSVQPSALSDVVIGRLVMPFSAAEKMNQFLRSCLDAVNRQNSLTSKEPDRLQ